MLLTLGCAILLGATLAVAGHDTITEETSILPIDHPAINYASGDLQDPVSRLDRDLAGGKAKLEFSPDGLGWLPSILKHLDVNVDSQMLVFSKTSFQAPKISPRAPRAIFFNDQVAVGSVQTGDVLEFASLDPQRGYIFYTLDINKTDQPRFDRRDVCLQCHQGPATLGVPGIMIASVFPDSSGMPAFNLGMPVTDDRTSFQDRWGGWYVTGTHGGMRHRGNAVARDRAKPDVLDLQNTQNLTSLGHRFDGEYLSRLSDIVALMTMEHQTRMTNLINRVGWETRIAEKDGKLDDPAIKGRVEADISRLVTYMTFADEAPMYDPVEGVSSFTKTFAERGPRDKQGRSLRDFDLHKRLFRYPLSYMVYSAAFDNLPDYAKGRIYRHVFEALNKTDDGRAALEILKDTKKDVPTLN